MASKKPIETVMGSAANRRDTELFTPWFRDKEKLIRAALRDSDLGRDLKRLLRKLVSDIAKRDDDFRIDLKKDLEELGRGKFHRPQTYPDGFRMMILAEMRVWKQAGVIKNLSEGYAKSAELHRSEFPDLTEDAVRGIYQREMAAQKKHKTS